MFMSCGMYTKKDIEVSTQKENFSYEEVSENFSKLQCGDIINIENSHYISNIAIPGRWKHTLIYLGSLKQVQELLDTSFPYYEKIVKMYKNAKGNTCFRCKCWRCTDTYL